MRPIARSIRNQRGITLLEGLVALLFIGLGVLAVAPLFAIATKENAVGADYGKASALGVERMELLRAQSYGGLTAGGDLNSNVSGYSDTADPDFTVRWRIVDNVSPANTKNVEVRVLPNRIVIGQQKEVNLITVRAIE